MARTRVKICCISSPYEAGLAIEAGADAIGLVGTMPSGPGVITDKLAMEIAALTPPPVAPVLLTAETTAKGILHHIERVQPAVVQIVTHIEPEESAKLAALRSPVRIMQVIHVEGGEALDLIPLYAPHVHAFLLDSGRPSAEVPELGGTGRIHDWDVSAEFVRRSPHPVFLAGGLTPENVVQAIKQVRPYGLDLCTGVRSDGALDPVKLAAFMSGVREADPLTDQP
ncbi:MAG: phosphoribosylanthranilate isomerase [Pseudomonadota bacterium]